ncbi:octopine/nopaline transport system permease protein [Rhizobiales bacterium GAS191]|nr:octopine/nopaline transport system permease protein [Rhizobiales bacterium GAS191]
MPAASLLDVFAWGPDGWSRPLLKGLAVSVCCAALGYALGIVLGFPMAIAKVGFNRMLAAGVVLFTTLLRGVPALLILYLLFFGTNGALMWIARGFGYTGYIEVDAFAVGVLAVTLLTAAYGSEILRAAYQAVPQGQFEAYTALGIRPLTGHLKIILPQMLRLALPGLGNLWIVAVKETTLLSVISLAELMRVTTVAGRTTGQPFVFYGAAALLYFLLVVISSWLFGRLELRARYA